MKADSSQFTLGLSEAALDKEKKSRGGKRGRIS
jgi:hypothetical protein